jgi:hypothetical protein
MGVAPIPVLAVHDVDPESMAFAACLRALHPGVTLRSARERFPKSLGTCWLCHGIHVRDARGARHEFRATARAQGIGRRLAQAIRGSAPVREHCLNPTTIGNVTPAPCAEAEWPYALTALYAEFGGGLMRLELNRLGAEVAVDGERRYSLESFAVVL